MATNLPIEFLSNSLCTIDSGVGCIAMDDHRSTVESVVNVENIVLAGFAWRAEALI